MVDCRAALSRREGRLQRGGGSFSARCSRKMQLGELTCLPVLAAWVGSRLLLAWVLGEEGASACSSGVPGEPGRVGNSMAAYHP